ncbi:MAG: hypothetical protein R2745_22725 [Vicinamibacterales bacterium]
MLPWDSNRVSTTPPRLHAVEGADVDLTLQSDGRWRFLTRPAATAIVARHLDDPSKDGELYAAFTLATTLRRR